MWLRDDEEQLTSAVQWKRLFELGQKEQWFPLEPQVKSENFDRPLRHD